ncbi:hypothetical protein [Granulicella sp. dw_53]|uniref:hypothetical protein n=1 Tax=Granulicella sp. dw_53 TaxID=2719792 RepID=UPI001C49E391|nr:hypothetical protein [Granulicella sp. dw_53]
MSTIYEKPELVVADPPVFLAVKSAIESSFSSNRASDFFKSLSRAGLRIRDFETVLKQGLLGDATAGEYSRLGNGDQGQIREFYLASLEKVAPELREKFFKLYAYY